MLDHLRRHLRTHEDKLDRLVACPFCKKKIFSGRNMRKHLIRHRELNLTEEQAKAISSSLKPDRDLNERDAVDEDQRSSVFATRSTRQQQQQQQQIRCIECDEEVRSVRKLFEHLSAVHFHRELTLVERKEMRLKHGLQKLHHCPFCSAYFIDYRLLRSHVLGEHASRAEEIGFSSKNSESSNVNATYKCPSCSMFFQLRCALDQHIIKEHLTTVIESNSKEETAISHFRCWYCRLSFPSTEEVVEHMTNQHETLDVLSKRVEMTGENDVTTSGLWTCSQCPASFKAHDEFLRHVSLHPLESGGDGTVAVIVSSRSKLSSTDEVNKYLNPMRIAGKQLTDLVVDNYFTNSSSTEMTSLSNRPSSVKDDADEGSSKQHNCSTQTPSLSTITTMSDEEMYLTTSSLSATAIDVNLASPDLTQVDFLPLTTNEEMTVSEDEEEHVKEIKTETNDKKPENRKKLSSKLKAKLTSKDTTATYDEHSVENAITSLPKSSKINIASLKNSLGNHSNTVTSPVPFRCWFCAVTFTSPEEVVSHMTNQHDNLDNLSRRIEMTDVSNSDKTNTATSPTTTTTTTEKSLSIKLKHLKRSADASLSPFEGQHCPKCQKKLPNKEAYELHMVLHEALENIEQPPATGLLLARQKSIDRASTSQMVVDDVSLSSKSVIYSYLYLFLQ